MVILVEVVTVPPHPQFYNSTCALVVLAVVVRVPRRVVTVPPRPPDHGLAATHGEAPPGLLQGGEPRPARR